MSNLQIFKSNEFGQVRVISKNGEPWFVAKDICEVLEISDTWSAVARLSEQMKGTDSISTLGGKQEMLVVSEAGLYKLVFTSRKPEAEKFTDWIAADVIPSIRKTGSYSIPAMSQAELTAMIAQNQVEIERTANRALEIASRADKHITNALDVLAAPPDKDWRHSMNGRMRGMCEQYGLSYSNFFGIIYKELEDIAGVDLDIRQKRLRSRMIANGATKTECNRITKLEVVERDKKLRQILEGIVRKYQAKYAIRYMPES